VRIVTRYVLQTFLPLVGISVLAFATVFVVVDLADHLSAFIDRGVGWRAVALYYVWYLPYVIVLTLPMATLLGTLFCVGSLVRHGELTAMKAAGYSLYRIAVPMLTTGAVLSVGAWAAADRVVPLANRRRSALEEGRFARPRSAVRRQVVLRDVDRQILSVGEYHTSRRTGLRVVLDQYEDRRIVERLRAAEMVWADSVWTMSEGERRTFRKDVEAVRGFASLALPRLTLQPEDLAQEFRPVDHMTGNELGAYIKRKMKNGGEVRRELVERRLRTAFPLANLVVVLIGVALGAGIRRTGRPLQIGICLLTCFLYYGSIQAGRAMGWNGILSPAWGGWGATLAFLGMGLVLIRRAPK